MLSPLMTMETNPPTSELMSPVHSFPNRFLSSEFHIDSGCVHLHLTSSSSSRVCSCLLKVDL
ncbi:hypothetical protein Hanom_Chr10g00911511 [Helianthus anomalus]